MSSSLVEIRSQCRRLVGEARLWIDLEGEVLKASPNARGLTVTLAMRESPQANTFTTVTAHFPKNMAAALTPGSGVSCGATATVQKHDGLVCFERLKADGVDVVAEGPWTRWKAQQRSQSGIEPRERVDYGRRAAALAAATGDGPVLVLGRRANQGVHDIETVVDGTPGVALAFEAEPTNLMGTNAVTGIVAALAAVKAGEFVELAGIRTAWDRRTMTRKIAKAPRHRTTQSSRRSPVWPRKHR